MSSAASAMMAGTGTRVLVKIKALLFAVASGVCLSLGLYALVGLLQAYVLFSGPRALSNVQFWAPVTLVFLGGAVICAYRAYHLSLESLKSRRSR